MNGVIAELNELIALKRYAQRVNYRPEKQVKQPGQHLSKRRGRGMDFAEARNYQAGDEIRHMEWRVTARTGRPHVKLYQEERERPVVILADFNASMFFGTRVAFKSVIAAYLSAIIAWIALKQGDKVGGLLFSASEHHEFTPRLRESSMLPFLASLSYYTSKLNADEKAKPRVLSDALLRLRRVAKPGSIIILISDFYGIDKESEKHLHRLSTHNEILAYHICDPFELAPPNPHCYAVTNGEQELLLDTTLASTRQAYQAYCDEELMRRQTYFKRLKIRYHQVRTDDELAKLVWRTFPRRTYG